MPRDLPPEHLSYDGGVQSAEFDSDNVEPLLRWACPTANDGIKYVVVQCNTCREYVEQETAEPLAGKLKLLRVIALELAWCIPHNPSCNVSLLIAADEAEHG